MSILHELSTLITVRNYIRMLGETNHPQTKDFVRKSQAIDAKIILLVQGWDISSLTLVGDLNGNSPHDEILESLFDIKEEITQLNRALIPTKVTTFSSTEADFNKSCEMVEEAVLEHVDLPVEPTKTSTEVTVETLVEAVAEATEATETTTETTTEPKKSKRHMDKKPLPTKEELDAMLETGNIAYKPRTNPPTARPDPLPSPIRADLPTKKPIKNGFKKI